MFINWDEKKNYFQQKNSSNHKVFHGILLANPEGFSILKTTFSFSFSPSTRTCGEDTFCCIFVTRYLKICLFVSYLYILISVVYSIFFSPSTRMCGEGISCYIFVTRYLNICVLVFYDICSIQYFFSPSTRMCGEGIFGVNWCLRWTFIIWYILITF